jgi:hypothetical protein
MVAFFTGMLASMAMGDYCVQWWLPCCGGDCSGSW